jgi:hypothetical protein
MMADILPPSADRARQYAVSNFVPAKWLRPDGSVVEEMPVGESAASASYNYIQSDEDATYKYYGFISTAGWRFKRKTLATGVWEVASGTGDYDAAWADRENKEYGYL